MLPRLRQYEELLYGMVCTVSQILVPILRLFIGHDGFVCVEAILDRNHLSLLHQKGVNYPVHLTCSWRVCSVIIKGLLSLVCFYIMQGPRVVRY